jgi:ribose transport system substrate-binding protein
MLRSRRRQLALTGVVLVSLIALFSSGVAGGASAAKANRAASQAQIKIGFINLSGQIPYSIFVLKSFQAAAKTNHVKLVACDSRLSIEKAITCAQLLKSQHVDGIANFQGNQAASPRICAAGPKVPVVAVDIPQKPCQKVYFGANNYQTGYLGGVALGTYAKQKWNCQVDAVINFNTPVNQLVLVREKAEFAGVKAKCPNVTETDVAPASYTTDATIAPFTDVLTRLPGAHHILVLGVNDDVAIGAIKAAQSSNRLGDLYVVGQGGDPTSWPYLCGKNPFKNWVGEVGYFPQRYGQQVIPILLKLIKGKKQPKTIYLKPHVLTPSNITSFYPSACK